MLSCPAQYPNTKAEGRFSKEDFVYVPSEMEQARPSTVPSKAWCLKRVEGRLSVTWKVTEEGGEPRLALNWHERGITFRKGAAGPIAEGLRPDADKGEPPLSSRCSNSSQFRGR